MTYFLCGDSRKNYFFPTTCSDFKFLSTYPLTCFSASVFLFKSKFFELSQKIEEFDFKQLLNWLLLSSLVDFRFWVSWSFYLISGNISTNRFFSLHWTFLFSIVFDSLWCLRRGGNSSLSASFSETLVIFEEKTKKKQPGNYWLIRFFLLM